ncbi:MAG TPA: ABC transporter ATP-binding protein [Terriglobia bacterium]|nr:ABC transporter ATP-binding protein [Terriglobia bacterium]
MTILGNGLNLLIPRIIAAAIDRNTAQQLVLTSTVFEMAVIALGVFIFAYLQGAVQTYTSERVAKDLRRTLVAKVSLQDNAFVQDQTPARLLTNLTSDVDNVKMFVSQAMAAIISSLFLIVGATALLISIDWELALAVLAVLPIIAGSFAFVMRRVRKLFKKSQEAVDRLNKVINESILGSALIRLVNSQHYEYEKFLVANAEARDISLSILKLFVSLVPLIMFSTNLATLTILTMGGRFVILGDMTIGDFTAFNSYLAILIFPVIVIGFMSNVMAQAGASYGRIQTVLDAPDAPPAGGLAIDLRGEIEVADVSVVFGEKTALKDVSFTVKPGTRTAVIGPTAAGKTQLLYLLTGLQKPSAGSVKYDGVEIDAHDKQSLYRQIGFVFQDTIVFNLTLRENIAFSPNASGEDLARAIETAELKDFIESLPQKLDTVVSERGSNLSGGQKQRIMLARALALNPRVLLLDDFTARVDTQTERRILENVQRNYPGITVLSVTQKIASVESYDQIVLLMEGEALAIGRHDDLLETSPEYAQIYESQRSVSHLELLPAQ